MACPPPPAFDVPECPVPVPVVSGSMSPACYGNDCAYWGPQKAYDLNLRSFRSLAIVQYSTYPHMQFDFNDTRTDITAVRITARADCCVDQSQNLNVYLSNTTKFWDPISGLTSLGSMLCSAGVRFNRLGETATVLCPVNTPARYLTVVMNGTNYLSLQEVTALYDGKPGSQG